MSGTDIIVRPGTAVSTLGGDALDEAVAGLRAASKAKLTRRAYTSDWNGFAEWCAGQGVEPMPADPRTVGRFLANLSIAPLARTGAPASASTINRKAAAIASVHRTAGYDNPCAAGLVRDVLSGLRKTAGRAPNKKKALTADLLVKVVRKIKGDGKTAARDRALLLLAFGAALRRSELVQLTVEDLEFRRRGVMVTLRRSKTDQDGEGRKIAVLDGKLHVPDAIKAWLACAGITTGRIFPATPRGNNGTDHLSENHFARIVKARCEAAGLDPDVFSGHSLRRGFATTAGDEGADLRLTANHMRHVKLETTMGYMEDGELFQNNAGKGFM